MNKQSKHWLKKFLEKIGIFLDKFFILKFKYLFNSNLHIKMIIQMNLNKSFDVSEKFIFKYLKMNL